MLSQKVVFIFFCQYYLNFFTVLIRISLVKVHTTKTNFCFLLPLWIIRKTFCDDDNVKRKPFIIRKRSLVHWRVEETEQHWTDNFLTFKKVFQRVIFLAFILLLYWDFAFLWHHGRRHGVVILIVAAEKARHVWHWDEIGGGRDSLSLLDIVHHFDQV